MPFLNLNTFSALFIGSGMAFQRMLPRKAREFMPKDIVLVLAIASTIYLLLMISRFGGLAEFFVTQLTFL